MVPGFEQEGWVILGDLQVRAEERTLVVVAACGVSLTPETPSAVKRQEGRVEVGRFTTAAEGTERKSCAD